MLQTVDPAAQVPRVSSEEALHRMVTSMHVSSLPEPAGGCHQWINCLQSGSHSTGAHYAETSGHDSTPHVVNGSIRGYDSSLSRALGSELCSPKQSSSHNSTICSSQSWVNVESVGESNAVSKCMPGSELPEVASATDYTKFCSKDMCTLPQRLSRTRLTRENMQCTSREQYVQHVHGTRLADIVQQIRSTSPFSRFVLSTHSRLPAKVSLRRERA